MARADAETLLSLDRYAKILGINPAHFNTLVGTTIMPLESSCQDLWFQHSWQNNDSMSREDLAIAIHDAEEDLAKVIGYYPAPKWISQEIHSYPRYHRRELYGNGLNNRGLFKSISPLYGRFLAAGQRTSTLVGTATVAGGTLVYSDPDGDGFSELATITLPTTLTDECELNSYFAGEEGAPEWEIRPAKTKAIASGNVTLTYDSWLFTNPDLWEAFTTIGGPTAIDLSTANFVTSAEVRREFTDFGQISATFFWEPLPKTTLGLFVFCSSCGGSGCAACSLLSQDGCIHTRDVRTGTVVPQPANFNSTDDQWDQVRWAECREPDQVKISYYAGEVDNRFKRGDRCDRLSDIFAHTIAWLATARLEKPFCGCGNSVSFANSLHEDLALSRPDVSFQVSEDILDNPLGTRKGEVMAWRRIHNLVDQVPDAALV